MAYSAVVEIGDKGALDVYVNPLAKFLGFVAGGKAVNRCSCGFGEGARFAKWAGGDGRRAGAGGVIGAEGPEYIGIVGVVETLVESRGRDLVAPRGGPKPTSDAGECVVVGAHASAYRKQRSESPMGGQAMRSLVSGSVRPEKWAEKWEEMLHWDTSVCEESRVLGNVGQT